MKKLIFLFAFFWTVNNITAQNVGIGGITPTLAKLEVSGTFGAGKTVAAFGSEGAGISIQRSSPAIGFNQYRDATSSKYMSNGFASSISLNETTGTMAWDMYGAGLKGGNTPNANRAITILNNGNIGIRGLGASNIGLVVAKQPENVIGTAVFEGYNQSSYFANSVNENTYIRSGSTDGDVVINNIANGITLMPNNTSIGIGGSLNPVTSLELFGSLGITKRTVFNICGNILAQPGNCSFMVIETCGTTPAILTLGNGTVQGQILLIYSNISTNQSYYVNETTNIDLASKFLMDGKGETLLLMWRLIGATGRWTEISRGAF